LRNTYNPHALSGVINRRNGWDWKH